MLAQALILAGGKGTRLRPLTNTAPKPVLPLVNRPLLTYMLKWLASHGVKQAIIALGFLAKDVRAVLGDCVHGIDLTYVEELQPLGTAGAVKFAEQHLEERFLVLNGDILTEIDLTQLADLHMQKKATATIALTPVEDTSNYGLVRTGRDGAVTEFIEKPDPDQIDTDKINAGAYVLEKTVLDQIPAGKTVSIECEIFPRMIGNGLYALADDSYWLDIGTPERYLQATADILSGRLKAVPDADEVLVNSDTCSLIDRTAEVAYDASIGSFVSIADSCVVESGTVIENATLLSSCKVGRDCLIKDSIVGPGVHIGDGSKIGAVSVIGEGAVIGAGNLLEGERIEAGEVLPEAVLTR